MENNVENDRIVLWVLIVIMTDPFMIILVKFNMTALENIADTDSRVEKVRPAIAIQFSGRKYFNSSSIGRVKVILGQKRSIRGVLSAFFAMLLLTSR